MLPSNHLTSNVLTEHITRKFLQNWFLISEQCSAYLFKILMFQQLWMMLKYDFGFQGNQQTRGHKHQLNNSNINFFQMKWRYLNAQLLFMHELHCITSPKRTLISSRGAGRGSYLSMSSASLIGFYAHVTTWTGRPVCYLTRCPQCFESDAIQRLPFYLGVLFMK